MIGLAILAAMAAPDTAVSIQTLLPQMWDLSYLTRPPQPAFTSAQASSYDRASNPGPNSNPLANGDAGQFIRTETNDGRKEDVMADLKGPGTVVRVWSANPHGTIRFYFDGESKPRLEAPMADLLTGKVKPFTDPFAYMAGQGANLYFPLPYSKSLKVTAEGTRGLYYHVGYRTYTLGTDVKTFDMAQLPALTPEINSAASHLLKGQTGELDRGGVNVALASNIQPGTSETFVDLNKGGTIVRLTALVPFPLIESLRPLDWQDPFQPHNVLRNLLLHVEADGEKTIEAPLGDFFATTPGINPLHTLPFEVQKDGMMICRLPMPFHKRIRVSVENVGPVPVMLKMSAIVNRKKPADDAYHLMSQWTPEFGSTRPMHDMNLLTATGEGYWIGSGLHVSNPSPAWWGEGDEKAYVDGETFPSTFGTGTEDYYGYAWGSTQLFDRPYHGQNRVDGPANAGHSDVHRWNLFDPIPYTKSLKFDLEMWHWAEVNAAFDRTAYWYAKPGGTTPVAINQNLLTLQQITPPAPVFGAIEGEKLTIASKTGGTTENQGGFWEVSGGLQLWWRDLNVGDKLVLKIPVAKAGTYEVIGNFCKAQDYGIHKMKLNGKEISPIDFYNAGLSWERISLGTFDLPQGESTLEIECTGNNAKALPARMFALDYLLLNKK